MSSPARKRLRLSSPTYEAGLADLNPDDLDELDRIEFTHSQQHGQYPVASSSSQRHPQSSQSLSPNAKQRRLKAMMEALQSSDDKLGSGDSEFSDESNRYKHKLGFTSAAALTLEAMPPPDKYDHEPSSFPSSPKEPPLEKGYSSWFQPLDSSITLPSFQTASKSVFASTDLEKPITSDSASASRCFPGFGFASAVNIQRGTLEPSKAALELAAKKLKEWSEEDETLEATTKPVSSIEKPCLEDDPIRPVLGSVLNSPSLHPGRSPKPRSLSTPVLNRTAGDKPRAFRSPLIGRGRASSRIYPKGSTSKASSDENDVRLMQKARPHSVASIPITDTDSPGPRSRIESNRSLQYTTPIRTPVQQRVGTSTRPLKPAFSTPFKQGMRPGEPGRESLGRAQKVRGEIGTSRKLPLGRIKATGKVPLRESGLIPQQYTPEELENMGVNIAELKQITPQTAPFYVFHTSASYIPSTQSQAASGSSGLSLGPKEAQDHLRKAGRNATQEWVENQWALVLWKLAGLATLDPPREATPSRRWCWRSVLEQLEARYDKELEKGARPALRLITTGDAPAGSPLVLVITAILSSERERLGPNGRVVQDASAEIEVSDGWYRLRASVDAPLARAVIRGIIRPGRKIAVAGAKLDNLKKDPCEILEAYNSCILTLSGNGSHLAPWHAKLGFQTEPFVATLGSLTPDGGPVPFVDIIVEKVHPIAFLEFLPGDRPGEKIREGPRGEAEEAAIEDTWRKRRDAAESKVRDELSARWSRWEGFADRLERSAGSKFNPCPDDMPPDHIEDLLDELDPLDPAEVSDFVRQLAANECGWLARYLRQRLERDREHALEEIEVEVNHTCPPREVRNFRIVQVRDARIARRPANRIAHLCIWDVLSLCVSEGGKAGAIEPGQRFLMTSLVPMQRSCWMGRAKDDMVYLSTTRNTRFYRLK